MTVIKVLHLIDSSGFHGAEAVMLTLMDQSAQLGHVPVLGSMIAPGGDEKPVEAEAIRKGFAVRQFPLRTLPSWTSISRILRTIREERIDLVHTHGYKPNIVLGFLPRSIRSVPVVATLHGWCSTARFSKLRFYERLAVRALAHFDGVAVVSARMLEHPNLTGRKLPLLTVIPNAASPEAPAPLISGDPDTVERFCRRKFTFGSIGRLAKEKDFTTLLESYAVLRKRGADCQLLIMGDGPEHPVLVELIRQHGLGEMVQLPGYVEGARRYLPLFGAYVLSSTIEGMPMTILEAFAEGIPIVSTAVGEVPQMLEQGRSGLLVPPGDVQGLANAMERIFENADERKRLADASRRMSDVYNSAVAMAQAYLDFYHRALEAGSST